MQVVFSSRRKFCSNNLKAVYPAAAVADALAAEGIDPSTRPQELSLEQLLALFATLGPQPAAEKRVPSAKQRRLAREAAEAKAGKKEPTPRR